MSSTAYARGTKAASVWKRLSRVYFDADDRFVAWAERNKIPASIGKYFVPFSVLLLMTLTIIAGFALGATMLLVSGIVYMVRYIQLNYLVSNNSDESSSSTGPEYRNGREGYGYYYGADDSIFSSACLNDNEEDKA
ncbi:DUF3742 family protein [Pantoea sp. SM3]|uniref:DUF3742 family protein n=1 Tax=Pantoea sp. SM3 TaxID=1628192 RepID=UPI0005F86099|nr:DUF3742 family protein [Pantoea sp. SM3]KJV33101.1 hypothetical protein VI01_06645 [Pantoea sp. SM3]